LVPEGVDLKFFFGRGGDTPKDDEVFLDVHDAFFASTSKVQAILKYAYDNEYDYVLQCDDDVFVNVPLVLASDFAKYDYSGNASNPGGSNVPFSFVCNFGVWFSRKAMEHIIRSDVGYSDFDSEFDLEEYRSLSNVDKARWHADLWNGQTLAAYGIVAHHDDNYVIGPGCLGCGSFYPELCRAYVVHLASIELMHELYRKVTNDLLGVDDIQPPAAVAQHSPEPAKATPPEAPTEPRKLETAKRTLRDHSSGRWNGR